ncbi:MAG: glycosyltransferase family 4 protein [Bacteroidetes bacterium]|nr:glycosyltransferase family 4 protein [Bacteroidota bacterium]
MENCNTRKKVLHIITLFSVGGATENTIFTVDGLIKRGYDVDIITGPNISSEGSMYSICKKLNLSVLTFNNLKRDISPFSDIIVIFQLYLFIKKNNYDIVHTHSSKAGIVGRIAAWLARTPIIIHHNHAKPYHRFQSWFIQTLYKSIERFTSLFCDKIVSVTYTIVDEMVKDKIAPREKFVVIRSGFNIENFKNFDSTNNFKIKEKFGLTANDIVIGKIARLSVIKGHIYLLQAFEKVFRQIPNVKLLLIGDGENKNELLKFIDKKRLNDKIIFTGLIPTNEMPSVISLIDIVVHTALLEGLPRVFTQSMLMGKPVISFDLDGAHEVIEDGKNGYLIEPMNIEMLTEKIIDLVSNTTKSKNFGSYAKDNIKDDFSIMAMVENNNKLYQELLKKRTN